LALLLNCAVTETNWSPSFGGPASTNSPPSLPAAGLRLSQLIVSKPPAVVGTLPGLIGIVASALARSAATAASTAIVAPV